MCGPSQEEKDLQAQQAKFSATLTKDYATTFANQQEILSTLNKTLQPIVEAGPNQQGYSAAERTALSTQAIESNAQGVQQAEQAVGAQMNAAGGGKSFLPSGVNAQINAGIESGFERNLSNEQLGITKSNYETGRQNWQTALAGEFNAAGLQNPVPYAGSATSANSSAFGEAHTINEENNQLLQSILGGIAGVGHAVMGGIGNLDTTGGSTGGEQVGNFLAGL